MRQSKKISQEGKMKKYLRTAILGMAVSAAMVGGASAGVIETDDDAIYGEFETNEPITIASEAIPVLRGQAYDLDPSEASFKQEVGKTIIYKPGITLNEGDKIKFQLSNATFNDTNYYFIVCENMQNNGDGEDLNDDGDMGDCFELGNIVAGGQGENYVTVRIAKPTGVTIGPNTLYVLAAGNTSVGNGTNDAPKNYNRQDNPTIKFDNTISATTPVSIKVVYAEDVGGTELRLAETSPVTLIDFEQQFAISFIPGDSTIDVTSPSYRKKFLEEGDPNDILTSNNDTDLTASSGVITIDNDSDRTIEDYIPDNELDKLNLTLGNASTNYEGWDFAGNRVFLDGDGNPANNNAGDEIAFDAESHSLSADVLPNHGETFSDDIYLGVDGETVLNPQVIPLSAEITFTNPNYTPVSAVSSNFITWGINGAQFKVPYLYNSSTTWVRISNDGPVPGDISVDLYDENGNYIANVPLGTVEPHSSKVIFAPEIVNAAKSQGWSVTNVGRFTAKFTVTAPAESISAVAVQRIPGGVDRVIPVLDRENAWDQ